MQQIRSSLFHCPIQWIPRTLQGASGCRQRAWTDKEPITSKDTELSELSDLIASARFTPSCLSVAIAIGMPDASSLRKSLNVFTSFVYIGSGSRLNRRSVQTLPECRHKCRTNAERTARFLILKEAARRKVAMFMGFGSLFTFGIEIALCLVSETAVSRP
jgi:hypothetical protein